VGVFFLVVGMDQISSTGSYLGRYVGIVMVYLWSLALSNN
jgi:hypothetical protein